MKVCILFNDDEYGYLKKLLRDRYGKSLKTEFSTLLKLAANEVARMENKTQVEVNRLEEVWSQTEQ